MKEMAGKKRSSKVVRRVGPIQQARIGQLKKIKFKTHQANHIQKFIKKRNTEVSAKENKPKNGQVKRRYKSIKFQFRSRRRNNPNNKKLSLYKNLKKRVNKPFKQQTTSPILFKIRNRKR